MAKKAVVPFYVDTMYIIPERDRQTDRQTNGRTDGHNCYINIAR